MSEYQGRERPRSRGFQRSGDDSRGGERQGGEGSRGFRRRIRVCVFCADARLEIDYKQPDILWRYVTDRGKIRPRRQTGACARHQRQLAVAIKRARHLAMLPFAVEHPRTG